MKTRNKLTAALLLLAMVLSLFGTGVAGAAEGEAVTVAVTEPELAWAPLAQDAVIAYERHEAGYTAALDYAGDNVTLNLTAVPAEETGRAQENARLYIRTGVVLTPGKTYRVGFSLWAEKAQPSYAVCLDGAWAEGAYGMLEHRSIPAGGVDRVQYQFTPQADCGELVLRLLLGKTGAAGNAIRLSGLSVQEVAADEVGQNVVLADHLNYNTGGVVRAWANSDCGATLTCTEDSATLTVTKRPDWPSVMPEDEADCPVQVWKIKLLVSTGLKPEPGKLYHLTMDIDSTYSELYELCLNEGTTEKGYGVKYNQQMCFGKQTVDELVAVPGGKSDPGELVVQLSLGKFKVGSKVTVSNVHIEEAKTKYTGSLLPDTFSLRSATSVWTQEPSKTQTSSKDVTTPIPWGINAGVSSGGDRAGEVSVVGGQVTMKVAPSADLEKDGVWNARLNFDTGETLEAGKSYLVSYAIQSNRTYGEYEALYGTGYKDNGADNNGAYIERKGLSLTANTKKTDSWLIRPEADGALLITLQMGKTDRAATVTVSDLKIEEMALGAPAGDDLAKVVYPDASTPATTPAAHSFSVRVHDGHGGELTGDGESSVSMTCTGGSGGAGNEWMRGLFAANVCALKAGYSYQVSYKILSTTDVDSYEVRNNKTASANPGCFEGEDGYGKKNDLPKLVAGVEQTVSYAIEKAAAGNLGLRFDLGVADTGTVITISNIQVTMTAVPDSGSTGTGSTGENMAKVNYPTVRKVGGDAGAFTVRSEDNYTGELTGDGESSVSMTCTGGSGGAWQRGLFVPKICALESGHTYQVSYKILSTTDVASYEVRNNKNTSANPDCFEGEDGYGIKNDLPKLVADVEQTVSYSIEAADAGYLGLRFDLGVADTDTVITISNIQVVDETAGSSSGSTPELTPGNLATVTYPAAESSEAPAPVSFRSRESGNFKAGITGNGSSAVIACTGGHCEAWQRGVFVDNVATLEKGHYYEVSADVSASVETVYEICYNKDDHFGAGKEKGFGARYGLTAGATAQTVKYTFAADADSKLLMLFNLGNADDGAVLTVSGIHVREVPATVAATTDISGFGAIWEEHDGAYTAELTKTADSAILAVTGAPEKTSDKWQGYNTKLFIRTGFVPAANSYYKVSFKIKADKAQSAFHALYNGTEVKAYDGEYNISLAAGVEKTVTHVINAGASKGELVLQLELGLIDQADGNTFTVRDVKIEKTTYQISRGFENQLAYSGSSPVLRITNTPFGGEGPFDDEEWKVKMFIDTGFQTHEDETYRVSFKLTTDDETKIKVCYNRDDVENGYGTEEGVRTDGTFAKEVEHTFSPREEEETGKLIIQLMLGAVEAPNRVMVSDLKIERVLDTYSGESALPKEILFRSPGAVDYWAHEDYTVNFAGTNDAITANITGAPAKGAEPWKIKLFLDSAVILQPGKYYRVTADVAAKSTQDIEVCYNNGGIEMGYDSLGGIHLAGGESQTIEKIVSVPAGKSDVNNLMLQFNLGRTNIPNAITVSGVKVEEVSLAYGNVMPANFAYTEGDTITSWTNPDYTTSLDAGNGKATLHILEPASAEVWKAKLLVHTGAMLAAGKTYLVRADLLADKSQGYEVCYNNEETEKGFDVLYGQSITGGVKKTVEKSISVPASMTDAGELVLQFSVGGGVVNDFTVSNVSVQELSFGSAGGNLVPGTVVNAANAEAGRNVLRCSTAAGSELTVTGARLRAGDPCAISFNAKADWNLPGTMVLRRVDDKAAVLSQPFMITAENQLYTFTTAAPLAQGGVYELAWQFDPASGAGVEITDLTVTYPGETLTIQHAVQNVSVNGVPVEADTYNINQGNNYIKLRDLAMLLNDTDAQFAVRYNAKSNTISLTSGKTYSPIGGELTVGADLSACCARSFQDLTVNGETVNLKAYNFGGYNFFRIRDLSAILGFQVDYIAETNTVAIQSPMTPEAQEKAHAYDLFFLPEIDGESQPYVGDTMPFYENGTYYIYYLKDGGDAYNHSVYLVTTQDFVHYTEYDDPVLHASREDVQDSWIGTGSVVKADGTYYFFYTGFNSSGSQEYHEKIMVAKSSSPMGPFEKVAGWAITPPSELGQKNDFRDPQAYYDPAAGSFSLTVTAGMDGRARILKYTVSKDLSKAKYDGVIFTDPTGDFWNMECSDTFRLGNKWYLTYSGQDDTLWYAMANSRFGPYSAPVRMEGKIFYAAKHVEDGKDSYMVGWARKANSASSTYEVAGWAGNVAVQKLAQRSDGSLYLVPVDAIVADFAAKTPVELKTTQATVTSEGGYSYQKAFTATESFMLKGEFTCAGAGTFGLAFDFNGKPENYKLISIDPKAGKLSLLLDQGDVPITETKLDLKPGEKHAFTYIQDGSIGIFYVDGKTALTVRVYGSTDKPVYLFAENNAVTFTSLKEYTR